MEKTTAWDVFEYPAKMNMKIQFSWRKTMDPSLQESNYKNKWHQRLTNLSEIMYSNGSEFILFLTKPYSMMNS